MQNALTISAMQHIINNLQNDIHEHLEHWPTLVRHLNSVEALLCVEERRLRLEWTCIWGTPHAHLSKLFKKWSATLYEDRWREVVTFMRKLRAVLLALTVVWGAQKYIEGVDFEG